MFHVVVPVDDYPAQLVYAPSKNVSLVPYAMANVQATRDKHGDELKELNRQVQLMQSELQRKQNI